MPASFLDAVGDAARGGPAAVVAPVHEQSQVGDARRAAIALGADIGLDEAERSNLALVVTEAATNLARHAKEGVVLIRALGDGLAVARTGHEGVEVLAIDRGPGMADLAVSMRDGFSTAGTSGHGLGAMRRLADAFDIFSVPGAGTVLAARVATKGGGPHGTLARPPAFVEGVACTALAGESACGDSWAIERDEQRCVVFIADGLGHGPQAAAASSAAVEVFRQAHREPAAELIQRCHLALRATRGAAVAVAEIDSTKRMVRFAGIGNIAAAIVVFDGATQMASMNGTVGHQMRTVQEFTYPWPEGATLVMHSDGLSARWRADQHPGLLVRHPALLAGVLWRDFARGRDDATVVCIRERR